MSIKGLVDTSTGKLIKLDSQTVTNDYQVTAEDYGIVVDATSNTVTVTMPSSPSTDQPFSIACINSTFAVDIDFNGKNFYASASNESLFYGENLRIQFNGTFWVGA